MSHKLNIDKQIKHFWPCQSNHPIGSTALRSLFLTKSRKETFLAWIINLTSVTAVAQCANKYKITHSPTMSITAFHCFADMHTIRQTHNKGKSVRVVMCHSAPPWNQVSPRELCYYNLHSPVCRNCKDCKFAAGYTFFQLFQAVITI